MVAAPLDDKRTIETWNAAMANTRALKSRL